MGSKSKCYGQLYCSKVVKWESFEGLIICTLFFTEPTFLSEDDKFKHSSIERSFHLSGIFPTLFPFPALFKFRKKLVTALIMKMGCRCRSGNKTLPVRGPRACSNRAWGPSAGHQGQERLECPSQLLTSCTLKPSPAWFGLLLYFSS